MWQHITVNNSEQNLGVAPYDRTNNIGNLSVEKPTIEQMNAAMVGGSPCAEQPPAALQSEDRLFGNHIREAVAIVKDWVNNP